MKHIIHIYLPVLQPGFKKGRVHIIKRALSSREAASEGECGRGYGGSPPKKMFENREICILPFYHFYDMWSTDAHEC